jgi:hypothetical protein
VGLSIFGVIDNGYWIGPDLKVYIHAKDWAVETSQKSSRLEVPFPISTRTHFIDFALSRET